MSSTPDPVPGAGPPGWTAPEGVASVVGHEGALAALRAAAAGDDRPTGTWLLAGPGGVGKRTCAVALAQAVVCEDRGSGDDPLRACGTCRACRLAARESHADVLTVIPPDEHRERAAALKAAEAAEQPYRGPAPGPPQSGARDISVDRVREFLDGFSLTPAEAPGLVGILDDTHLLNPEGQNALLKLLEEPPDGALLVMVSDRPEDLLETVRSRCRRAIFQPLTPEQVRGVLTERLGHDPDAAERAARLSGGSPGLADRLLRTGAVDARADWIDGVLLRPAAEALDLADELLADAKEDADGDEDERRLLRFRFLVLRSLLRDAAVLAVAGDGDPPPLLNPDLAEPLARAAERLGDRARRGVDALCRAQERLDVNANKNLLLTDLALELTADGRPA